MSQFEFSSRVTIGQYLPTDSFLHRLDPRARILIFSLLVVSLTITSHWQAVLLGLVVVLFGLALGRIPLPYALRGLIPPLPFLLFLAVIQVLFPWNRAPSITVWHWWVFNITHASLLAGGLLLLRFTALILTISLATFCLSTSQMIHGLDNLLGPLRRVGIPTRDLIMIVQITLRFLPLLAQVAERIAKAQASRGADWGAGKGNPLRRARQIAPVIVPLFLAALHKAENMALAMDARAYGTHPFPTSMAEMRFRWQDGLMVAAALGLCVLILQF